jgi:hypothetical protein
MGLSYPALQVIGTKTEGSWKELCHLIIYLNQSRFLFPPGIYPNPEKILANE